MHRHLLYVSLGPALVAYSVPFVHAETYLTEDQVRNVLFPGETITDTSVILSSDQVRAIAKASGVRVRNEKVRAYKTSSGGWLFFDNVVGKHEHIDFALALDARGVVKGVEILTYRETYGGEVKSPDWRAQFKGKSVQSHLKLNDDIQNISGATLSSNNLTKGVRRLIHTWDLVLRNL